MPKGTRGLALCSQGDGRPVEGWGLCRAHYQRWCAGKPLDAPLRRHAKRSDSFADRFWTRVSKDGPVPEHAPSLGACWIWTGAHLKGGMGYGTVVVAPRPVKMRYAHVVSYEMLAGAVPEGLELDHLCRVSLCVNPGHLEAVTHRENVLRGESPAAVWARRTHCSKCGAALTTVEAGRRGCRSCRREDARLRTQRYRARQRGR